jgi:hypothetical protein
MEEVDLLIVFLFFLLLFFFLTGFFSMSGDELGVVVGIAPPGTVVSEGVVDPSELPGVVDPPGTGVIVGSLEGVL